MEKNHYQKIFELGKQYLLNFEEVNNDLLNKHLELGEKEKPKSINELFRRLLESLSNRRNMPQNIGDIDKLEHVLHSFNPKRIVEEYGDSWKILFQRIKNECNPKGKMVLTKKNSYWTIFCKGTVSGAKFLSQFSSFDEFNEFVNLFYFNESTRAALPMLIAKEVFGLGFALACDFLKESGYTEFVKTDVHIKAIFKGLKICRPESDDYEVFKEVVRFSKIINQQPYVVDKLFWLIGSGDFYLDEVRVKTNRNNFIKNVRKQFKQTF